MLVDSKCQRFRHKHVDVCKGSVQCTGAPYLTSSFLVLNLNKGHQQDVGDFEGSQMGLSFFGVLSCFKRQKVGPPRIIPPNHTPESYPESYPRIIPLKTYAARC